MRSAGTAETFGVIKIGGSLLDLPDLGARVVDIADGLAVGANRPSGPVTSPSPLTPLILPGGGAFVDQLRRLDQVHRWPDEVSHDLALSAMSLTSRVLESLHERLIRVKSLAAAAGTWSRGEVPVLDVGDWPELRTELPAGWDVTSDAIAAWVAWHCRATLLVLVKSRDWSGGADWLAASRAGLVDAAFPVLAEKLPRIDWVNLRAESLA